MNEKEKRKWQRLGELIKQLKPEILTWQQLGELIDRMDPAELKRKEVIHYAV